jgi:branched-subunit amino acid transport protein
VSDLGLLVAVCTLGTYTCRGLGVLLAGRINLAGDLFRWVTCVAYAMIAGLIARIIVIPTGPLAVSLFEHRLLACLIGLAVYRWSGRNLFFSVAAGAVSLVALNELRPFVG